MATKFSMTRDINGYNGFGLMFSDTNYKTTLSAGAEQHFTVPMNPNGKDWLAIFSLQEGFSIWVDNNHTASVPTGSFAATTSQRNPAGRQVKGGDVLSFITPATTADVGVSFYELA